MEMRFVDEQLPPCLATYCIMCLLARYYAMCCVFAALLRTTHVLVRRDCDILAGMIDVGACMKTMYHKPCVRELEGRGALKGPRDP